MRLTRDAARERMRRTGGRNWDNLDVMDYVAQSEYLDSHHFGTFPVEGQVGRVVVNGKLQMVVYIAWNMSMAKRGRPAVHYVHVQQDIPFNRARDGPTYAMMLRNLIRNHKDGRRSLPAMSSHCLSEAPYDCLPFLSGSRIWRETVKCKAKYRAGDFDGYSVGWFDRRFFMISPGELAKFYVRVPNWWKKYDSCRALHHPTILLFGMHRI